MRYLLNMNLCGYVVIDMNLFNAYIDVDVMSFAMNLRAMIVMYYRWCDEFAMNLWAMIVMYYSWCDEFCDEPTSDDLRGLIDNTVSFAMNLLAMTTR